MRTLNLLLPAGMEKPGRRTGRSTAQALRLLAQAIASPCENVDIFDHHGTKEADFHLANMLQKMIEQLGLKYIEVKRREREPSKYYVVSSHIREIP